MIRFFHVADIHFGVENYGRVNVESGIHSRLLDFKKSLSLCIDRAIEENIDFFLLAGDAYKTAYPSPTQQKLLMEELFRLYKAGIPVVIVVGNHDHPLSFGKAHALDVFASLPVDGFHVFAKPDLLELQTKNGLVQIVGIPWPTRNNVVTKDEHRQKGREEITTYLSGRVSEMISHFASIVDPNVPVVLTGHLTVSNGIFSGSEKRAVFGSDPLFLPSELALAEFDYVALGHLHRYQNLNKGGYPDVVYSGSIDRVDFGERKEVKGFCSVKIETDAKPVIGKNKFRTLGSHEFVSLPTRSFIQVEVKIKADVPQTQQVIDAINSYSCEDAVLKVIYHIPEGKKDNVDICAVQRELSSAWYVVGIIPVHVQTKRSVRANLNVNMGLEVLLSKYIESKDDLKKCKEPLLARARELLSEENS